MCVCVCVCVCVYSVTTKSAFIPASYVHEACISPVNEPRVCYHARTHVIKRYGGKKPACASKHECPLPHGLCYHAPRRRGRTRL